MVEYHFSLFWLVVGVIIFAVGACMVGFSKPIADQMGISNYDRLKTWGVVFCVIALLLIPNLLPWLIDSLFAWLLGQVDIKA